jgi:transcriptional regulator with XRE-family HTH domain
MPPRLRPVHEAVLRLKHVLREGGAELREGRLAAGLTQGQVAMTLGWSASKVGRIERGEDIGVSALDLGRLGAVIGFQVWLRLYPAGGPLRDASQLAVEAGFIDDIKPGGWKVVLEADTGIAQDLRAFDLLLVGPVRIGVEVFTRLRDVQAQVRRVIQKQRDAGVDRLLLVFKDTHANRRAVAEAGTALKAAFPLSGRAVMTALRAGRDPGDGGIVFV